MARSACFVGGRPIERDALIAVRKRRMGEFELKHSRHRLQFSRAHDRYYGTGFEIDVDECGQTERRGKLFGIDTTLRHNLHAIVGLHHERVRRL